MNAYLLTGAAYLIYLGITFVTARALVATKDFYFLFGALALIGLLGAAAYVWFYAKAAKAAEAAESGQPETGGTDEVDLLIRDAEAKLSASKMAQGASIGNLPLIFILGEAGSAKTSTILNSGLEPELLAGQVYQESTVASTRAANLWFARNAVLAEAGGKLLTEPARWIRMVRRLRPGALKSVVGGSTQAPRGAVLCFDCERFPQGAGGDQLAVAARNLNARLGNISETLGISLPVYVLFTRTDRIPFFSDYVRTLSNDEASQVLGVTLPLRTAQAGVYAEEETQRLNGAFNALFHNLCDKRLDFLPRENDPAKQPGAYEFPREFLKLRSAVVQFLVDVCRPSQLRASPFLRGFYFSGVRPVVVNEMAAPAAARPAQAPTSGSATGVFSVPKFQQAEAVQPQFVGSKKVPQWLFLPHLFHSVVLQDRAAMGASGSSTKTSTLQRILLGLIAALFLFLGIAFLVSWIGNRGLVNDALAAAQNIPASDATTETGLPSQPALERLESLRQSLEQLTGYERDGAPLHLRWGLYTGTDLYPLVRKTYYARFAQLLFAQTQAGWRKSLESVHLPPLPADEYGPTYDTLKAYLITTSNHDKSTKAFLSPFLLSSWSKDRNVHSPRQLLAQKQFDFYSEDLKLGNPYSSDNDKDAIERGRTYLSKFSGIESIYQFMLAAAGKDNKPVNFNRQFPGSSEVVINNRDVAGAFTKGGWAFMKNAIPHADQFFGGEPWVLCGASACSNGAANVDRAKLEQDLRNRYVADYIAQWRAYLKNSAVLRYANLKDAAKKLNVQSGNQSPILELFWLASQHTGVDSPKIVEAFQPVQFTVPPANVDRYVAPSNQPYLTGLVTLQSSIDQAANMPGAPDPGTVSSTLMNATNAKISVKQIAQNFRIDQEAHVESTVQKLLEDPITNAEGLLRAMGPAELNGKGKGLCAQFNVVTSKFPFNSAATADASIAEVNSLLKPGEGALWAFYDMNLKSALVKQGAIYVANSSGGTALNPAFVTFFNTAARLSDSLYAGGSGPKFTYTVKLHKSENITSLSMMLDGQPVAANDQPKQVMWPGPAQSSSLSANVGQNVSLTHEGVWSAFRVFNDADRWENDGAAYNLDWTLMQSFGKKAIGSGATPGARLNLNLGSTPMFFHKGTQGLQCVSTVAR